ncbi:MAG TPA: hypothetical protein VJ729_03910 [Nitrososphaeraceae archaeon]|nr:hypothetical protein [Nitrososphaeraceae archaeon]
MSKNSSTGAIGFGNNSRFPYYYGPEGRLVLDNEPEKDTLAIKPKYNDSNIKFLKYHLQHLNSILPTLEQKKNKEVNN